MNKDMIKGLFKSNNFKITPARILISYIILNSKKHFNIDDIIDVVKKKDPSIGVATIYRTINLLDNMNLIIKHDFGDKKAYYETKKQNNHYHIIDIESNEIMEFENKKIEKVLVETASKLNYEVQDYEVKIYVKKKKK